METLNLTLVRSFLAVVQTRSFQDAAQRLAVAQPTVSQHIQKLEEQLGGQLFLRSRSGCIPTRAAKAFLPYAESLLRLNERALAAVHGAHVRIGASSNIGIYLLQPYLKRFLERQDAGSFDLLIDRNPTIADKLEIGELDIALMEWWDQRPGLSACVWKQEPLVLIVPPGHTWAQRHGITRDELRTTALLGGEAGTGTGRLLLNYFGSAELLPSISMQLGSTEAVKQAVKAGLGISLVFASAVIEEIQTGSLAVVPLMEPGLHKELWLIWRQQGNGSVKDSPAFIRHVIDTSNQISAMAG